MRRILNFSAGPAMLPEEVMRQAQSEFLDWNHTGMSVMEISHRSPEFGELAEESKQNLRDILQIPDNYHILFLHGGGRTQFAMVPMNLLDNNHYLTAAYLQTGVWSELSNIEARRYCQVKIIADSEPLHFKTIPEVADWNTFSSKETAYLYYVDNETVNGLEFPYIPESHGVPLISDMSSNLLTRPIDVSKFGIIFACAQKNLGPAGVTLVIIRDDLLEREPFPYTPSMLRYKVHVESNSLYNTAPTFPWYMVGLVLKWIKRQGGLETLAEINQRKANKLYEFIDNSNFYDNIVEPKYRSRMNVVFRSKNPELDQLFVEEANKVGLTGLKGHRFVGGLRASIYNAMPESGVDRLLDFMQKFESEQS